MILPRSIGRGIFYCPELFKKISRTKSFLTPLHGAKIVGLQMFGSGDKKTAAVAAVPFKCSWFWLRKRGKTFHPSTDYTVKRE